jgi:hypothetical protein
MSGQIDLASLTPGQRRYLKRRVCGLCEQSLLRDSCGSCFGAGGDGTCTPELRADRLKRCLAEYRPRKKLAPPPIDVPKVAAMLTKVQRAALLGATKREVYAGEYWTQRGVSASTMRVLDREGLAWFFSDENPLTPLGLAVREHLERQP